MLVVVSRPVPDHLRARILEVPASSTQPAEFRLAMLSTLAPSSRVEAMLNFPVQALLCWGC